MFKLKVCKYVRFVPSSVFSTGKFEERGTLKNVIFTDWWINKLEKFSFVEKFTYWIRWIIQTNFFYCKFICLYHLLPGKKSKKGCCCIKIVVGNRPNWCKKICVVWHWCTLLTTFALTHLLRYCLSTSVCETTKFFEPNAVHFQLLMSLYCAIEDLWFYRTYHSTPILLRYIIYKNHSMHACTLKKRHTNIF